MTAAHSPSPAIRVVGRLDPCFAWDGDELYSDLGPGLPVPHGLRGAAATAQSDGEGRWRLLRDPLGLDKLFWVPDGSGGLVVSANPRRLVDDGHAFGQVRAFPRGRVLDLGGNGSEPLQHSILPPDWFSPGDGEPDLEAVAARIRSTLDRYLAALAAAQPSARVFVCLSGGLDSSGIAALAARHFADVVAVSFDLVRPGGRTSEDRETAERLSCDLGLPLLLASVTGDELLAHLDAVLVEGIDWRDFNVHAGLVNAALAAAIAEAAPAEAGAPPRLVLTGDLANEFLADYQPERYGDATYYGLPRLAPDTLRASLVRGLDTSHREVGVFGAWDLPLVQPYAAAVDAYLALPASFLAAEGHKQRLCRLVFRGLLPEYVYERKKSRAQVGDPEAGGTLALCIDRGVDATWLRRRYAALHEIDDLRELDRFMRAGLYRAAVPSLDLPEDAL